MIVLDDGVEGKSGRHCVFRRRQHIARRNFQSLRGLKRLENCAGPGAHGGRASNKRLGVSIGIPGAQIFASVASASVAAAAVDWSTLGAEDAVSIAELRRRIIRAVFLPAFWKERRTKPNSGSASASSMSRASTASSILATSAARSAAAEAASAFFRASTAAKAAAYSLLFYLMSRAASLRLRFTGVVPVDRGTFNIFSNGLS